MEIGSSQTFVIARGFRQIEGGCGLVDHDGGLRLFAEITADPDRPEVRPTEAYRAVLSSLQPGWVVRWLQIFWPDPVPRTMFSEAVAHWQNQGGEGLDLLRQGLQLFMQEAPLPFVRRTILEFLSPGEEGAAWWQSLPGLLETYGLQAHPLAEAQIRELARWVFNPDLAPGAGG
jgi:hypothetical protein